MGGSGAGGAPDCAPEEVLLELNAFLSVFESAIEAVAGHASSNEATGFFLAPGLPQPPSTPGEFASIFMPCTRATLFVPYCTMGRCTQLECTGDGAGWVNHFTLEQPLEARGFRFEELAIEHHWTDGADGTTFDYALTASGPEDRGWDATGSGALDPMSGEIELTFPALLGGTGVLTFSASMDGYSGALLAADTAVATVSARGLLEPTDACK